MKSMTGFGRGSAADGHREITILLTSVNRKSLEVSTSMPKEWQALEATMAAKVRERIVRGRIHISVDLRAPGADDAGLVWDDDAVVGTLRRLEVLASRAGVPFNPDASLLFSIAGALKNDRQGHDAEVVAPLIESALAAALEDLVAMRTREGEALTADLQTRAGEMNEIVKAVRDLSTNTVSNYRDNLMQRLRQAGLDLDLEDERVLKEIALFADRCDISEELTRLDSHLGQLRDLFAQDESIGRKAEFLLQEMAREIHTIGSKANDLEVAKRVMDFKTELERVREQVQNVE